MADTAQPQRPAWQTEELEDEWIDLDDPEDEDEPATTTPPNALDRSDVSFTEPIGSLIASNDSRDDSQEAHSGDSAGTFIVREDVPAEPLLPQTPGKKMLGKDFFSPLALEKMFEPPSPPKPSTSSAPHTAAPVIPSRLSQMYIPGDESSIDTNPFDHHEGGFSSLVERTEQEQRQEEETGSSAEESRDEEDQKYQFTFAAPQHPSFNYAANLFPNAQSTPGPARAPSRTVGGLAPPLTDPRLRLFQFQYDTFTREHLSAMVDSIAVNTPSGGSGTTLSKEATPASTSSNTSISRLRSAKRIKLSPASDFSNGGDGAALIMRPNSRRDYVGESKSLMEKIRQARDYSTISTQGLSTPGSKGKPAAEPQNDVEEGQHLNVPRATATASSTWTSASSKNGPYSSIAIREQAASLMNQIRSDVKSHKRLFSVESEGQAAESSQRALQAATEHLAQLAAEEEDQPVYEGDTELISDEDSTERGIPIGQNAPTSTTTWRPPRTHHRRSPADETNDHLDDGLAQMSLDGHEPLTRIAAPVFTEPTPQPPPPSAGPAQQSNGRVAFLSPHGGTSPAYPSSSIRAGRNDDLTRFVSSSTASGGTVASGSTASFVKHQGPKHMTHISPSDIPPMPERVGKMVFDRETMKWVKTESSGPATRPSGTMRTDGSNESEDPFKDIESLRDESPTRDGADANGRDADDDDKSDDMSLDKSRLDVQDESEPEDAEEAELVSFSFDGASAELPAVRVQLPSTIDSETEEEDEEPGRDEQDTATTGPTVSTNHLDDSIFSNDDSQTAQLPLPTEPALEDTPPHMLAPPGGQVSTPQPSARLSHANPPTPIIRSVLKSGSVTPLSAAKEVSHNVLHTPANKLSHRRSVSFSDGKRDGPIRGLGRKLYTPDGTVDTDTGSLSDGGLSEQGAALIPSARSKRIAEMLEGLGGSDSSYDPESPSKSSGRQSGDEIHAFGARRGGRGSLGNASSREMSRRMFSGSLSGRSSKAGGRNATFLTECSFGVAHDRLVQVITDVQPFEPYWDQLAAVDLSGKNLDSVARLKEFLPRLDSLTLNSNQIAYLSGVPGTVRTLSIASNCLTAVTSFSHLLNLESLDISRNSLDSLRQLECLRHLRELRADGNMIDSIDGLQKMDGLVKLSLQGNALHSVDVTGFRWARLEMLNMSHNRLGSLVGLASLPALIALNLDHNQLPSLVAGGPMPRLRILRVSANRLQELDAGPFPNLRTLYADNNALGPLLKAHRLAKLENLSLRNQGGRTGLSLALRDVRDIKRLYLSGNPLDAGFISEACYNLVYLELAACRITALPRDFARLAPNLRVLNLNYNFLEDVRPLEGLVRLRRVTIIGSRVSATRQFVRVLRGLADAEMVDFRMNPCTLGWYLPLLMKDMPGSKSQQQQQRLGDATGRAPPAPGPSWKELDAKFRRDLPDEAYVGRLAYRGLVMRACPALHILDGVEVSEKERDKAEKLLKGLSEAKRKRQELLPPAQQ